MCKIFKVIFFTIIVMFLSSVSVFASDVVTSVTELIDNGKKYNSKVITLQGEAIGELLERGEYSFVNINDGTSAMGIYLKTHDANIIKSYGDYHNIGDLVRIEGVFNRACTEHGGDMDIHSNSIEVVSPGYERTHDISSLKIISIIILTPFVILGVIKAYKILK